MSIVLSPAAWAMPQVASSASTPTGSAPAFQVATIKPGKPEDGPGIQIQGRRFATSGTSLVDILKYAYGIHAAQIVGGPEWLRTEKFDVVADPNTETRPSSDQMKRMVQQLVQDRFALRFHSETRELPVYAITVAKTGSKLATSSRGADSIPTVGYNPTGSFAAGDASMVDLAAFLQRYVTDRPVVDRTGLAGRFDLTVTWAPDGATENASHLPGFFTAIQEQLGLKLIAGKAPVEVLVIDHVEQPSAN